MYTLQFMARNWSFKAAFPLFSTFSSEKPHQGLKPAINAYGWKVDRLKQEQSKRTQDFVCIVDCRFQDWGCVVLREYDVLLNVCFFFWASSSFIHCLAALDFGAGVEQPFRCLIVQNRQAVQSMVRSMNWTLEDNMADGLFSCATLTGRRGGMPHLHKQERKRPTPVRLRRTQALLGRVIPGGWVLVTGIKMRSLVGLSPRSAFHWWSAHCTDSPKKCPLTKKVIFTEQISEAENASFAIPAWKLAKR